MTCAHVLGLIDAAQLATYPAAHLDAARDHARECATCGRAMNAAAALATDLAGLPQPEPPAHLATAVLARIARLEPAARSRVATSAQAETPVIHSWQDRAAALAGVAAASVVVLSLTLADGAALDLTSPRLGGVSGLFASTSTSTSLAALAASLVLYLIALFVPLRRTDPALDKRVRRES